MVFDIRKYNREYYHNKRKLDKEWAKKERINHKIWYFLNGYSHAHTYDYRRKRWMKQERLGLFKSGGCCWVCGEDDPFALESHHLFKDEEILMSLCGTCHQVLDRMGWSYLVENRGRI